jgi:hypothetical protein
MWEFSGSASSATMASAMACNFASMMVLLKACWGAGAQARSSGEKT